MSIVRTHEERRFGFYPSSFILNLTLSLASPSAQAPTSVSFAGPPCASSTSHLLRTLALDSDLEGLPTTPNAAESLGSHPSAFSDPPKLDHLLPHGVPSMAPGGSPGSPC